MYHRITATFYGIHGTTTEMFDVYAKTSRGLRGAIADVLGNWGDLHGYETYRYQMG